VAGFEHDPEWRLAVPLEVVSEHILEFPGFDTRVEHIPGSQMVVGILEGVFGRDLELPQAPGLQ
jgi:hypothetical protein